ncbi:MAG: hypothetical protein SF187_08465 [Deltaproteobacteria bacterium]|nr:hypothetical protein [Deltaproteobacteria bacterium]
MTRLVKICFAALCAWAAAACSNVDVKSRVFEGTYCSAGDESPYYQCDNINSKLICIQTYTVGEQRTPVRICRRPCATRADCASSDQVCCGGPIVHEDYGFSKACVPRAMCQTDPAALLEPAPVKPGPDAGAKDAGPDANTNTPIDAAPDASDLDAPSDA